MLLSLAATDGSIWSESKPRDSLARQPVPSRCVLYTFGVFFDPTDHPRDTFPTEELPVRLAHRVKELDELPHNLSAMPSINKVKDWYAQSFEVPLFVHHPHASLRI